MVTNGEWSWIKSYRVAGNILNTEYGGYWKIIQVFSDEEQVAGMEIYGKFGYKLLFSTVLYPLFNCYLNYNVFVKKKLK